MLWFEALPPRAGAPPAVRQAHLASLEALAGRIDGLLVPEILDGDYRTEDPAAFAGAVQEQVRAPATVAVLAGDLPARAVERRLADCRLHGVRSFLFVGPRTSLPPPSGIGVLPALRRHAQSIRGGGGRSLVVTIPSRRQDGARDEPRRLADKARAGADVAVSQILLEPDGALRLLRDLHDGGGALPPPAPLLPLLWSLAPVVRRRDLAFLERLGVVVPPRLRKELDAAPGPAARLRRSMETAEETARRLLQAAEAFPQPTGFCVSQVMEANGPAAIELAERVRDVQKEFRPLLVA